MFPRLHYTLRLLNFCLHRDRSWGKKSAEETDNREEENRDKGESNDDPEDVFEDSEDDDS